MLSKPVKKFAAAMTASVLILAPYSAALAGGMGSGGGYGGGMHGGGGYGGGSQGPNCPEKGHGGGKINIFNKNINIFKPVNINKNININKNLNINKNININKNVNVIKNVIVNKGGGSAMASAFAAALASSSSNSSSSSVSYSGSYSDVTVVNRGGGIGGAVAVVGEQQEQCEMQEATIVKAIHAVCIAEGREFAASHMIRDTWIDSGLEGEIARCIPGAHLKIVVGDVLQSDQGMAGTYAHGDVLECGDHEALVHFKDGQLKCAPAVPVPDCTERTNLRKYGTGDFFFSYRGKVCVGVSRVASSSSSSEQSMSMEMDGGVGESSDSN